MMDFKINFDELDYTRMIAQGLKVETTKMILKMNELSDTNKILVLKKYFNISDEE